MAGRHHRLNGHEWARSESWWWTGKPKCCSPWGRKELDTTEPLNWTDQDRLCNCPQKSISLFSDLAELHFLVLLSLSVALYQYLPSEMWMVVMCFSFMARPLRKWLCSLRPFYFPTVDWNFNDKSDFRSLILQMIHSSTWILEILYETELPVTQKL